jgi:hypothetical protein
MTVDDLLPLGPLALHDVLRRGHGIDPTALDDREYHGVALGNPRFVEWVTWKTFKKVFRREPDGTLRGWNVAVEQRGPHGPFVDRQKRGQRVTYWHYEVVPTTGYAMPADYGRALLIDYGRAERGACNPQRRMRDPLVAVNAGSPDLLLGYTWADLGIVQLPTPTFFALVRGGPLTYQVPRP